MQITFITFYYVKKLKKQNISKSNLLLKKFGKYFITLTGILNIYKQVDIRIDASFSKMNLTLV